MNDPDLRARLERLEDAHAFGERNVEQLSEQLIELFAKIGALDQRLRTLEGRLASLESSDDGGPRDADDPA